MPERLIKTQDGVVGVAWGEVATPLYDEAAEAQARGSLRSPPAADAEAEREIRARLEASYPGKEIPDELVTGLARAEAELQPLFRDGPRWRPAPRTCLGPICRGRVAFASTHAGNRLCAACAAHVDGRQVGGLDPDERLYSIRYNAPKRSR